MAWQPSPRVDCEAPLDLSGVAGKTAVVTGGNFTPRPHIVIFKISNNKNSGASGIGEAYVRALYTAGWAEIASTSKS